MAELIQFAGSNWGLLSAVIVVTTIVLLYRGFEKSAASSREIAVIAVLGALAAIGRVPFAAVPSVQPTTFLVIVTGYVFGWRAGFMVGSTAALVSNLFLGQGPWTPWQMFAWGLAGAAAAACRAVCPQAGQNVLWLLNFSWGYIFGAIMNIWTWTAFIYPQNWQTFLATFAASLWFDTMHAVGNVLFFSLFGAGAIKVLQRIKRRMELSYLPAQEL